MSDAEERARHADERTKVDVDVDVSLVIEPEERFSYARYLPNDTARSATACNSDGGDGDGGANACVPSP